MVSTEVAQETVKAVWFSIGEDFGQPRSGRAPFRIMIAQNLLHRTSLAFD
jgi:hypothetical protein